MAHLQRLSLTKLKPVDFAESNALFDACRTTGFFATDLLETVDDVFGLANDFYNLNTQEKLKYASPPGKPLLGYKAVSVGNLDSKGTTNRCEIYGIRVNDILSTPSNSPLPQPACLSEHRTTFEAFIYRNHKIVEIVSSHLDRHLNLPEGTLSSRQWLGERSANQIRMIKAEPPPTPVEGATFVPHTDVGRVTVLFNILGGLQILPPGGRAEVEDDWEYVQPAPGCAIINIGDAMVKWTNGILRSKMHRKLVASISA